MKLPHHHDTYLVTGGAGFIGSCLTAMLVEAGAKVVVLDALTYAGFRENLAWLDGTNAEGSYELMVGSITDRSTLSALLEAHQPQVVVNVAAESHVDHSIAQPGDFIQSNIVGAYNVFETCRHYWLSLNPNQQARFRCLHVSTDEVFGALGPEGRFDETSPLRPNSPYAASKAAADHLAHAWHHTYGLPVLRTHCTNNYGPRQYPEKLIPRVIAAALAGDPLPIYGSGQQVRDWIHVHDHCRGLIQALEYGTPGASYGFGGDAERSNLSLVHMLCDLLDAKAPSNNGQSYSTQIQHVGDRAGHDFRYAFDASKAQRELGWQRQYDLAEGLAETVDWYLNHKDWYQVAA